VRVEDTVVIGKSADVIAVPYRDAQTWHELRGDCVRGGDQTHEGGGPARSLPPDAARKTARFQIGEHRAELARLERREFKQLP
jgi:hypothetical protein